MEGEKSKSLNVDPSKRLNKRPQKKQKESNQGII